MILVKIIYTGIYIYIYTTNITVYITNYIIEDLKEVGKQHFRVMDK